MKSSDRRDPKMVGAGPARKSFDAIVRLSDVTPEKLRWLSPGRLAAGKITILDGDPGLGKSTLLCEFAARITCGDPLPDGQPAAPRGVILMSAEDDLHDTIRPRIDAAGGDPARVISLTTVPQLAVVGRLVVIPDHIDILEELIVRTQSALVVIDPLLAFLSSRHSASSEQAVRRALAALKAVAESTGAAMVAVRHLNKSPAANPLYRGGGSIGIIGAARCGLLLAQDPEDPERRILASTKTNLGRLPPSLAFRLVAAPGGDIARVVWDGDSHFTAAQLLRENEGENAETHSVLAEAREWLRAALAGGPRAAKDILREAGEAGIGHKILYSARRAEGVQIRKERVTGGRWVWSYAEIPDELSRDPDT